MEYHKLEKLNQSLLKQILKHPQSFIETEKRFKQQLIDKENGIIEKIKPHFLFGKIVDFMLTEDSEFEDTFYVMKSVKMPSDTIIDIVTIIFNEYRDSGELEDHKGAVLEAASRFNYQPTYKEETRFQKIIEAGSDYFKILQESANKLIISEEEYSKALIACAALKSDPYTKQYLVKTKDVEIIKKPIIEFTFQGIDFKGELDIVTINHSQKKIYPVDIKTMSGHISEFSTSFFKYRYDFQAAFYDKGIREYPIIKKLISEGYVVEYFKFLVVEKECKNSPMVYTTSHEVLKLGALGGTLTSGKKLEGIVSAIKRFKYHTDSNEWNYPAEYYECGELILEV